MKKASVTRAVTLVIASSLLAACATASTSSIAGTPTPQATTSSSSTPTPTPIVATSTPASISRAKFDAFITTTRKQVKRAVGTMGGTYSRITVKGEYPHGITFVYVYAKAVDKSSARSTFNSYIPTLRSTFQTQVVPEMESMGITAPCTTWAYFNPNGSLVWQRKFCVS